MTDDLTPQPGVAVVGSRTSAPRSSAPSAGTVEPGTVQPGTVQPGTVERTTTPPPRARGRRRGGAPRWLVGLLVVVTAVSVVLAVAFGIAWSGLQSQRNSTATVRRVAHDFLIALTNFRPDNLDSHLANLQSYATGDFAKQANEFFGTSIRQALEQVQASSEGQVRYLYVQSLDGDQASVYGWVDQTFTNDKLTGLQTDTLQVSLSMSDTSSGWKISDVTVLNSPSPSVIP